MCAKTAFPHGSSSRQPSARLPVAFAPGADRQSDGPFKWNARSVHHHWTNIGNCFSRRATRVERGQRALDDRASIVRVNVHAKRFEDRRAHLALGAGKAVEDVPARCLQTDHVYTDRLLGSRVAPAFPLQRRDLGPDSAELLADDSLINLSKRKEMDQPPPAVVELH